MLIQAPILAFPYFTNTAAPSLLQTDASVVGLDAVLEQDGYVIAYASRTLNSAEQQYSTIQKECLVAVFVLKQFTCLATSFNYSQIMLPFNGFQLKRWNGYCVAGH